MALFAVEQQFNGERSLIIDAGTVVSADGWRVFRKAGGHPVATRLAGRGATEVFSSGNALGPEGSHVDAAGDVLLHQDVLPGSPFKNQLFVASMRRGRTNVVVIEAATAASTSVQWVFRDAEGRSIAALPIADVSHVETIRPDAVLLR